VVSSAVLTAQWRKDNDGSNCNNRANRCWKLFARGIDRHHSWKAQHEWRYCYGNCYGLGVGGLRRWRWLHLGENVMTTFKIGDIVALTPEANWLKVIKEIDSEGDLRVKIGNHEAWVTPDTITLVSRPETLEQKLARIEAENAIMRNGLVGLTGQSYGETCGDRATNILANADAIAVRLAT
jgi:hypothetical protein